MGGFQNIVNYLARISNGQWDLDSPSHFPSPLSRADIVAYFRPSLFPLLHRPRHLSLQPPSSPLLPRKSQTQLMRILGPASNHTSPLTPTLSSRSSSISPLKITPTSQDRHTPRSCHGRHSTLSRPSDGPPRKPAASI